MWKVLILTFGSIGVIFIISLPGDVFFVNSLNDLIRP